MELKSYLEKLQRSYGHLESVELLEQVINKEFKGDIALVSSFGAGSAALISMVAEVNPNIPVLFLDTEKHFPETMDYLEEIRKFSGLQNLIILKPDSKIQKDIDPDGDLWKRMPNRCCWFRKVKPLEDTLEKMGIRALITGRKSYQNSERKNMDNIELYEDGRFRVNPLHSWSGEDVKKELKRRKLPEHPLVSKGYLSIGCQVCTRAVKPGEDERAGRWAHTAGFPGGEQKTECGIHLSLKENEGSKT